MCDAVFPHLYEYMLTSYGVPPSFMQLLTGCRGLYSESIEGRGHGLLRVSALQMTVRQPV